MKTVAIKDLHGRNFWKEVDVEKFDKVIFLGDYLDSYDLSDEEIVTNLKEVVELKQSLPEKVELLIGNHDVQYMLFQTPMFNQTKCTGLRKNILFPMMHFFRQCSELFSLSYGYENYLWSHAGISNVSYKLFYKALHELSGLSLSEAINYAWRKKIESSFIPVGKGRGGEWKVGSIVWADREETVDDYLNGYHQIVGHSPVDIIMRYGNDEQSITYVDAHNPPFVYELTV